MAKREGRCDRCATFHPLDRHGRLKPHKRWHNGRKVACLGGGNAPSRTL